MQGIAKWCMYNRNHMRDDVHSSQAATILIMSLSAIADYVFTESSADGRMKTITWLQRHRLLANRMSCNTCRVSMNMVKRERSGTTQDDKWAWRCPTCSSIKSIRSESWFEGMHAYMHHACSQMYG